MKCNQIDCPSITRVDESYVIIGKRVDSLDYPELEGRIASDEMAVEISAELVESYIRGDQDAYNLGYHDPATPALNYNFGHIALIEVFKSGQSDAQNQAPKNMAYDRKDYDPETFERLPEKVTFEKMYVIWSNEHQAWWKSASYGYTRWIEDAGRYTKDDAMALCESGEMSTPEGERKCEVMLLAPEYIDD